MATPDKETQKVIAESADLARLTSSPEWKTAKRYLNDMFVQLDSWSTLPDSYSAEQKVKEMEARQSTISLIQQWVATLEGKAIQGTEIGKSLIDRDNITSNVFQYFPGTESK